MFIIFALTITASDQSGQMTQRQLHKYRIYRTLVFPCGSGIGLEIADALKNLKEIELIGATSKSKTPTHCPYVYPMVYDDLPMLRQDEMLRDRIIEIVNEQDVDVIFPGLDDATIFLARHRKKIESATNARIMLPSTFAVNVARSKKKTYDLFRDVPEVAVPKVYERWRAQVASLPYSVFLKPEKGQGSQGARRVDNPTELRVYANSIVSPMVMEYLPGDEYTVDCFADRERGLLFARARRRVRIRGGISVATVPLLYNQSSEPIDDEKWVRTMATSIQKELKMHGAFFFQVKKNTRGKPVLMEIAPRIAGAMAMFRSFGVNLPLLTIYEAFRLPIEILLSPKYDVKIMDKAYANRYQVKGLEYDTVYVDLDDTLLLRHHKVHTKLIRFLYQCVNAKKQIVLVTRSKDDPEVVLKDLRLFELFDRILHVTDRSILKSDVILRDLRESCDSSGQFDSQRGIFIDDSFKERKDVLKNVGIPVFDMGMLDVLIDPLVL